MQLRFQTAGIGSRSLALLIDISLLLLVNLLIGGAYAGMAALFGDQVPLQVGQYIVVIGIAFLVLLNALYFMLTEYYMGGQTLGKRWVGLRVIADNGQSATFMSILIRNLFRLLDTSPLIGLLAMLFHPADKRIGDMVAGTIVVTEPDWPRKVRRKQIDRAIASWPLSLPMLKLTAAEKERIGADDWSLLYHWICLLPSMQPYRMDELAQPITAHLSAKFDGRDEYYHPASYLIVLYRQLRADWEV